MILDAFDGLNWLAIVVATLAWFAFSAIWYSIPPLSKAWATAARVDTTTEGPPLALLFVPTLIGYFVTTVVVALIASGIGAGSAADGIVLGVVLGIGFGMMGALVSQVYERKGGGYFLINGLNSIIAFSIVGAIVSEWT